jgi:hypothetical protein
MKIEDMNEGVRILLERMETHPQEFNNGILHKWSDVVGDVMQRARGEANPVPFLDDAEVQAIYDKLRDLERHEFTAKVLRKLADTPEELEHEQLDLPYIPAIPRGGTVTVTKAEMDHIRALGVSKEVYLEGKRNEALKQLYKEYQERSRQVMKR